MTRPVNTRALLDALDEAAARDDFEGFQVAEYLLVCLHARGAKSIRTAQRKMAGADVARWNAARSATFAKIIARLELSLS